MDKGKSNANGNNSFSYYTKDDSNASPSPRRKEKELGVNSSFGDDVGGAYKSIKKYTIGKLFTRTAS